jgi:hypothetical protein
LHESKRVIQLATYYQSSARARGILCCRSVALVSACERSVADAVAT